MDTLKKILSNAEIVNIKYPEKVFTISFISQYFAFNVRSLAFPQALVDHYYSLKILLYREIYVLFVYLFISVNSTYVYKK